MIAATRQQARAWITLAAALATEFRLLWAQWPQLAADARRHRPRR